MIKTKDDKTKEELIRSEEAYLDYLLAKGRVCPHEHEVQMETLKRLRIAGDINDVRKYCG